MPWVELTKAVGEHKTGEFLDVSEDVAKAYLAADLARDAGDGPDKILLRRALEDFRGEINGVVGSVATTLREATAGLKRPSVTPGESEFDKKHKRSIGDSFRSILIALTTRDPQQRELHHNRLTTDWEEGGYGVQYIPEFGERGLAEGTGTTGGYTTVVQYETQIFEYAAQMGPFTTRCTEVPMGARSTVWPSLNQYAAPTAGNSAYYAGVQVYRKGENVQRTATNPTYAQVEMTAQDLTAYTTISRDLLQDSVVVLDAQIPRLIGGAIGFRENYEILRGTGSGQFLGILNAPATLTPLNRAAGASATIAYADLVGMVVHILESPPVAPAWFFHPFQRQQLMQLVDASNRLIFMPYMPGMSGGPATVASPGMLLGYPVYFWEAMSAPGTVGDCMLADVGKYLLGRRSGLEIGLSEHFLFDTDQIAIRAKTRNDGQPWAKAPVILADGAGTNKVSPFILLGTT